jgi:hypothetical protein
LQVFLDAIYPFAYCNGSTWQYFYGGQALTPPGTLSTTYAWTNQVSASVSQQTNGIWTFLYPGNASTSHALNVFDQATPSLPFTIVFRFLASIANGNNQPTVGISLRESGTGKLLVLALAALGSGSCLLSGTTSSNLPCFQPLTYASTSANPTAVGSTGFAFVGSGGTQPFCVKVTVAVGAAGLITLSFSTDNGFSYTQLYSVAKTTTFTVGPDHVGVYGNSTDLALTNNQTLTLIGVN